MKTIPLNIQRLQDKVLELWKADQTSAKDLGTALVETRKAMRQHGSFTKWYRSKGLTPNRVNYCMRLVQGKVKKTHASIPAGPAAPYQKAVSEAVRNSFTLIKRGQKGVAMLFTDIIAAMYRALVDGDVCVEDSAALAKCKASVQTAAEKLAAATYRQKNPRLAA